MNTTQPTEKSLLAPCGITCRVCIAHLQEKNLPRNHYSNTNTQCPKKYYIGTVSLNLLLNTL